MIVTIFKNVSSTSTGFHRPVADVLERIRKGESKKTVEKIRKSPEKERGDIKRQLPAICFSGTFNRRADNAMIQHSGIICLDFDKFPDTETMDEYSAYLKGNKYTFALFVSPSGNGLKVLVKIPPVFNDHRAYFKSLQNYYSSDYFDPTCINESRVCYESYDPDLYFNPDSDLFDRITVSPAKEVGKDKATLPVKSENQIIQNLLTWFNKNYSMSEGERNKNLFILASALNDFGISRNEAEKICLGWESKGFSTREIENTVKSAYKNTSAHGSKFFEDEHTKERIKIRIKAGDDFNKIKATFSEYTQEEIDGAIDDIKAHLAITEFWDYDKNNRISLSHHKYKQFLEQNGFFKLFPNGNDNFIFISISENLISNTTPAHIKDFILDYLYNHNGSLRPYDFMAGSTKFFKDEYLNLLETAEVSIKEDTKDKCYLYFRNCVVEVTRDKVKTIDYLDLDGYVWHKHIIDRNYVLADPTDSVFEKFINCVASQDIDRFLSIISVIGYLMHSYKTNSNNKAIIFNDEIISDNPNGGSGKGIICNAIGKMKRVATIDGKQFDFQKSFPYQTVSVDTQVLVFDDVKKNFAFENLFSLVTEGITLEKKNRDAIKLAVSHSPKIVITTNYTISGDGGSFERRKFEIELSSYFNSTRTPFDEFGHMLFDDWDDTEWAKFDNFMITCVQYYLKEGLHASAYHNLVIRKFINSTSFEFYEWIEEEKIVLNENVQKDELYARFVEEFGDYKKWLTKRRFSRWLELYAHYKGWEIYKTKSNGIRHTIFKEKNATETVSAEPVEERVF